MRLSFSSIEETAADRRAKWIRKKALQMFMAEIKSSEGRSARECVLAATEIHDLEMPDALPSTDPANAVMTSAK